MKKYFDIVLTDQGRAISGASVTVLLAGTGTSATLYGDEGITPKSNPVTTDSGGLYWFYVDNGLYDLVISATSYAQKILSNVLIEDAATSTDLSNSTDTAKGDALVAGKRTDTGAVAFTLHAYNENRPINVKTDFGAVGDGGTDDTSPIDVAITNVETMFLPEGTYIFSNKTFIKNIRVLGSGIHATTIKWKAGSAESSLFNFLTANVINVEFENLTIDGNKANQTDSTGYYAAIDFQPGGGSSLSLRDVRFTNGRIIDVRCRNTSATPIRFNIENCIFDNGLEGTATRTASYVQALDNVSCNWKLNKLSMPSGMTYGRAGLLMQRATGSTVLNFGQFVAIGNEFENIGRGLSATDSLGCVDVYSGADQIIIANNISKGSIGRCYSSKSDCGNIIIDGNTCINHDGDVPAIVNYDQVSAYSATSIGRNLIISNNIIRDSASVANGKGISIFGNDVNSVSDFENVIVDGNIIDGVTQYAIYVDQVINLNILNNLIVNSARALYGTSLSGYCKVKGNTISDCSNSGIVFTGSNTALDAIIQGNTLENSETVAVGLFSTVNSFVIKGNVIRDTTTAIETSGATDRSEITGNSIDGETNVWTKSGSYGTLVYDKNITSTAVAFATRELTIATGVITAIADWHSVDTEADAATDDLATINGGYEGRTLTLFASDSTRDVVVKDGTGNITLAGDFTMNNVQDTITLLFRGTSWYEISRSDNGA